VRDSAKIADDLKRQSIIDGFVHVPIYTSMQANFEDDLSYGACAFSRETDAERHPLDSSYTNVLDTVPELAEAFYNDYKDVFNFTVEDYKNMDFATNQRFSDMAFSEVFEGVSTYNFNSTEWHWVF